MGIQCPKCRHDNPDDTDFCGKCGTPLAAQATRPASLTQTLAISSPPAEKGSLIAGKFRIDEKLGRGGMGVVYKAEDTRLQRSVALKFLPPELTHVPEVRERFMREARAAAALDHPHICTVYEFEQDEERSFISMAYIDGQTLKERIESEPLKMEEAIRIATQVAEGLQAAHEKGVVHRDIKSGNVMLDSRGRPKIMDFGLARMTGKTLLTRAGSTMGTVAYMSPEQARGEKVDHRTDIWSFGVLFYEMLTEQLPFKGETEQSVIYSILKEKPKPLRDLKTDIPPSIEQVVLRCLEKDLNNRYQQIDDLIDDLKSISAGFMPEGIEAGIRRAALPKRKRFVFYSGATLLLFLFISMLFIFRKEPEKSIAVRPFRYLSSEPDKQYLADGVMEAILLNLSKMEDLRVISRTSVEQYRDTDKTVNAICRELEVAYLLEGSFQKYGDTARLIVQLIEPGKERQIWANEYHRNWTDIFSVQSEVAQTVAGELRVAIAPEEKRLIEKIPTTNMAAYDAYLQGELYSKTITPDNLDTAEHYYELALEMDPQLALAYTGIANVWIWRQQYLLVSPDEAVPNIQEAIERALELDENIAEPYQMQAGLHVWGLWDWTAGEEALIKAIDINPNYAQAHAFYSNLLSILGRPEEAMKHIDLALKLDPHSDFVKALYTTVLMAERRYEDCIHICREIYAKNPDSWMDLGLHTALYLTGRYEESIEAMAFNYRNIFKDFDHAFDQYEQLGFAGTLNLEIDMLREQSRSKPLPPQVFAELHCLAGNKEQALDYLEQAYEMRDPNLPILITGPRFGSLRDEPRFQELLRKMKLPTGKE